MKLFVVACLLFGSGCFWASKQSESVYGYEARAIVGDDGHVEGGSVQTGGGYAGLTANIEANLRDTARAGDPNTYSALGLGFSLRGSLLGILGTEHVIERYFDIGAEAGAGGDVVLGVPPHKVDGTAGGWYGAWVEFGTFRVESGYLALTGGIRREAFADPYLSQTQLMIGVAWRHRRRVSAEDLTWRD
jgi:hypothetical protein